MMAKSCDGGLDVIPWFPGGRVPSSHPPQCFLPVLPCVQPWHRLPSISSRDRIVRDHNCREIGESGRSRQGRGLGTPCDNKVMIVGEKVLGKGIGKKVLYRRFARVIRGGGGRQATREGCYGIMHFQRNRREKSGKSQGQCNWRPVPYTTPVADSLPVASLSLLRRRSPRRLESSKNFKVLQAGFGLPS